MSLRVTDKFVRRIRYFYRGGGRAYGYGRLVLLGGSDGGYVQFVSSDAVLPVGSRVLLSAGIVDKLSDSDTLKGYLRDLCRYLRGLGLELDLRKRKIFLRSIGG